MIPPSTRRSGMSLIEVLLAVVILGIGASTLMLATARCLAVVVKSQNYSAARRLIHQASIESPITREELEESSDSGDFDNGFRWEREITLDDEENRPGLYTVRTRIIWSERGRDRMEEMVTWVYTKPGTFDL
jgi:prepilin-type N-terminal cleavage/methylation domain-containing protein